MRDDENSIAAKHREDDGDEAFTARELAKARKAMRDATFCLVCDEEPSLTIGGGESTAHYHVACQCGGERLGYGKTAANAVADWNIANSPCVRACSSCDGAPDCACACHRGKGKR